MSFVLGHPAAGPASAESGRGLPSSWHASGRRAVTAAVRRVWRIASAVVRGFFQVVGRVGSLLSLAALLAGVAAIPVVNLWTLGVLLEAEGQVARTGRLRAGFPLRRAAARLGGIVVGMAVFLVPLQLLAGFAADAAIIDAGGQMARRLVVGTRIAAALVFVHLLLAMLRGGRLWDFFRPIANLRGAVRAVRAPGGLAASAEAVQALVGELRPWSGWKTGLVGAGGILAWTVLPTTLFAVANEARGPAVIVTLVGGLALAIVLTWLPILQAGYARDGSWRRFRSLTEARRLFAACPMLWTVVFVLGYGGSLVLYLFKIVAPPQDALWLMTPFFVVVIYPVRLLAGWAYARASRQERLPWWGWRYGWGAVCMLAVGFYVFLLFFTRDIGAYGKLVLYQQPFLLVPSPF